jgi:hypothetical protein
MSSGLLQPYPFKINNCLIAYPFTAPKVKPLTMYLCAAILRIRGGSIWNVHIAPIPFHICATGLIEVADNNTDRVGALYNVSETAKKSSFHENIKPNIKAVAITGRVKGRAMLTKAFIRLHPSTIAASSTSIGKSIKNSLTSQVMKGKFIAVWAITIPICVSNRPVNLYMSKKGMRAAAKGNIRLDKIQ